MAVPDAGEGLDLALVVSVLLVVSHDFACWENEINAEQCKPEMWLGRRFERRPEGRQLTLDTLVVHVALYCPNQPVSAEWFLKKTKIKQKRVHYEFLFLQTGCEAG